jgi:predicted nucleic acid-binding protein
MRLVVDASTLVAEALRERGRALLAHPTLDLVIAVEALSETEHELRRRTALIAERRRLDLETATRLLDAALAVVNTRVVVFPVAAYEAQLAEARRRIPRDARDAATVALALTLDCGIWTADHDFLGCGVPTWTTGSLLIHLAATGGD